jgi:hypothetical protein
MSLDDATVQFWLASVAILQQGVPVSLDFSGSLIAPSNRHIIRCHPVYAQSTHIA